MKMSKSESSGAVEPSAPSGPRYPYGLQLSLDNESLDKLGLTLPDVGDKLMLVASVEVTSVSQSEEGSSEDKAKVRRHASMQIVAMALSDAETGSDAAKKLYKE
jgi:hypothetical protein